MPLEQRPAEMVKPRVLIAFLATILAFFAISCLLILYTSAPLNAPPPAAGRSYQAENEQVSPNAAEVAQTAAARIPAARTPVRPALAEQTPRGPAVPQQAEPTRREPQAQDQNPDDPSAERSSASEQIVFKSRRALESVDPRELLREGVFPPR